MSETPVDNEEQPTDFEGQVRHKIDDAIDVIENFVANKISGAPSLMQAPLSLAANGAFATIRGIIGIPDDIGGDAD